MTSIACNRVRIALVYIINSDGTMRFLVLNFSCIRVGGGSFLF